MLLTPVVTQAGIHMTAAAAATAAVAAALTLSAVRALEVRCCLWAVSVGEFSSGAGGLPPRVLLLLRRNIVSLQ